ncbi:hypothetical protein EOD42_22495 [Rhodovarius crocodyli]|uniref:Anti-CBASS protein Acb1 n=1 Tax=Rhodovarius crocodyli TaxID=1979269 RepID=A0A437M173_9PROT|nr:hypothetical protein [Rhodovarius crocodyli]RVT91428.1 hypothetical protein EOD42_22495 [Rhodovarius crocodyli]
MRLRRRDRRRHRGSLMRSLYVCRPVLNAAAIRAWARVAGFSTALPADDMHVTVAFSKEAVDWHKVPPATDQLALQLPPDRSTKVMELGKAVVLRFHSSALEQRWRRFRQAGASWDHDSYHPHVTVSYRAPPGGWPTPPEQMQPYAGPLILGPERFQEVRESANKEHVETPLALPPRLLVFAPRAS